MTPHALAAIVLLATIPKKVYLIGGIVVGALEVILSIPLIIKKIPPNRIYGLANAETLDSRRVWYAANRFFGVSVLVCGVLTLAGTGVAFAVKANLSSKAVGATVFVVIVVLFVAAVGAALINLRRL